MMGSYDTMYALGVSQYGQMTAGSYCCNQLVTLSFKILDIGPQGIVHGTTITLMNAARYYLNSQTSEDMLGKVFVTAGLGGTFS